MSENMLIALMGIGVGSVGFFFGKLWEHLKESAAEDKLSATQAARTETKVDLILEWLKKIDTRTEKNESDLDAAHEKIRALDRAVFPVEH